MKTKNLVFDLDATLYYAGNALEEQCDKRICAYFVDKLHITLPQAQDLMAELRKKYKYEAEAINKELPFSKYDFVEYICDLDMTVLPTNEELDNLLSQIPNPKYILTDSTSKHVKDTLKQIAVKENHFQGICDAHIMSYAFKHSPEGYNKFFEYFSLKPEGCIMFEDSLNNLEVAKSLGMTTVLISPNTKEKPTFVDYFYSDITIALKQLFC